MLPYTPYGSVAVEMVKEMHQSMHRESEARELQDAAQQPARRHLLRRVWDSLWPRRAANPLLTVESYSECYPSADKRMTTSNF